jgi:hypothetical protein
MCCVRAGWGVNCLQQIGDAKIWPSSEVDRRSNGHYGGPTTQDADWPRRNNVHNCGPKAALLVPEPLKTRFFVSLFLRSKVKSLSILQAEPCQTPVTYTS